MARILVVEDEAHLADGLRYNLEAEGHDVDCVESGERALEAMAAAGSPRYALAILDIMLPGIDGFQVARSLRDLGELMPILMLTARGRSQDVMQGFEAGADDYLPKPFELGILLARVRALLRRAEWGRAAGAAAPAAASEPAAGSVPAVYEFRGRRIDFDNLELTSRGETLRLTLMEAQLLRFLIRHQGHVVPRRTILEEVWGLKEETDTRAIDNFIVRLRRHIEDEPANPRHLLTVRGVGYRFEP